MTEPTNHPTPVILNDEALAEIEARRPRTVHYNCPFVPLSETERDALCATVRAARLDLGSRTESYRDLEEEYSQQVTENTALREQLAEARRQRDSWERARRDDEHTFERIAISIGMSWCCMAETMELESRVSRLASERNELQSRLAQVEKERSICGRCQKEIHE